MVFDAIDYLNSLPLENKRVFEYGSGGSTLYWLSRNMLPISVEHDPSWFDLVRIHLDTSKVDYRLVQPQKHVAEVIADISDPLLYLSEDAQYKGYNFKSYVSQIDTFPNGYFDVILVDGRARPACIMHSAPKIKVNGLLILDNADRLYYTQKAGVFLHNYKCLPFYGVGPTGYQMWKTEIYVRQQ